MDPSVMHECVPFSRQKMDPTQTELLGNNTVSEEGTPKRKKTPCLACLIVGIIIGAMVAIVVLGILIAIAVLWTGSMNRRVFPNPTYSNSTDYIHFVVIGDFGFGNGIQKETAVGMANYCANVKQCDFIISTGDNIYESGVSSPYDPQLKTKFEDIYNQDSLKDLDWFSVLGNHDYKKSPEAEIQYSDVNSHWKMPHYYFNFTKESRGKSFNLTFVMTDTNPFVTDYLTSSSMNTSALNRQQSYNVDQLNMIENILSQNMGSNDSWTIVVGHHPVYSAGYHYNTPELRQQFEPLFAKYKLPLYLCGHDHFLNWLTNPSIGPTQYVLSGGGAADAFLILHNQ